MKHANIGTGTTVLVAVSCLVLAVAATSAQTADFAGFAAPGTSAQVFAPGLISTDAYEFAVTFTPDMREMYFTRRQDPGPNRILLSILDDGRLREPQPASFSFRGGEYEPCVSPDGRSIYFGLGIGIEVCDREGSAWSAPRALPPEINGGFAMAACVDAAGHVYFTDGQGLQVARRAGNGYRAAEPVGSHFQRPAGDSAHGFVAPDGSYLIFDSQGRAEGKGRADLYVSFRNADDTWSEPRNLESLNTAGTEMCASVSPDGRFLFFSRKGDIYWVDASVLDQYRPADTPITTGSIPADGATLFFKSMGTGDPIVVLHGGPGFDHRQFLPFIWELAAGHQVILYDQRGTGLSPCTVDSAHINIDTFVADIEAVRRHFGLEKMNLLGHSWGGILAMEYGLRHPDRLRSLVLCSTTASVEAFDEMRANYRARRTAEDQASLEEIGGSEAFSDGDPAAWEAFWRVWFRTYFHDRAQADRMDLDFPPDTIRNCGTVAGLVLGSIGPFDLHDELASITCPTLILHGTADPMPASYAERIHAAMPGSELVLGPDVGHWFFVDGTRIFADSTLGFLDRIRD